jgi:hypothetical protein
MDAERRTVTSVSAPYTAIPLPPGAAFNAQKTAYRDYDSSGAHRSIGRISGETPSSVGGGGMPPSSMLAEELAGERDSYRFPKGLNHSAF